MVGKNDFPAVGECGHNPAVIRSPHQRTVVECQVELDMWIDGCPPICGDGIFGAELVDKSKRCGPNIAVMPEFEQVDVPYLTRDTLLIPGQIVKVSGEQRRTVPFGDPGNNRIVIISDEFSTGVILGVKKSSLKFPSIIPPVGN